MAISGVLEVQKLLLRQGASISLLQACFTCGAAYAAGLLAPVSLLCRQTPSLPQRMLLCCCAESWHAAWTPASSGFVVAMAAARQAVTGICLNLSAVVTVTIRLSNHNLRPSRYPLICLICVYFVSWTSPCCHVGARPTAHSLAAAEQRTPCKLPAHEYSLQQPSAPVLTPLWDVFRQLWVRSC